MPTHIFVYGTLKPGGRFHQQYCPGLLHAIPAWTYGRLYDLPRLGYPAMTEGSDRIQGYCLSFATSQVLLLLDELEDYDPQRPDSDNEYQRQWTQITLCPEYAPSQVIEAWVYRMSPTKVLSLGGIYCPQGIWP